MFLKDCNVASLLVTFPSYKDRPGTGRPHEKADGGAGPRRGTRKGDPEQVPDVSGQNENLL